MPIPFYHPKPAPPAAFQDQVLPVYTSNIFSRAVFQWVSPLMKVGYSRPIEAEDLWTLPDKIQCQNVADRLEAHLNQRLPPSRRVAKFVPASRPSSQEKAATVETPTEDLAEKGLPLSHDVPVADDDARANEEAATVEIVEDMMQGLGADPEINEAEVERPPISSEASSITQKGDTIDPPSKAEKDATTPASKDEKKKSEIDPAMKKKYGARKAKKIAEGKMAVEDGKLYDMSLIMALWHTMWYDWSLACLCNIAGSALRTTAPLLTRQIISQLEIASAYKAAQAAGDTTGVRAPKSVGYGIGLAVALFVMELAGSLFNYQSQQRGAVIGFSSRASLIDMISRKSMRLSNKARIELPNGRLVTMISADCSFLDFAAPLTLNLATYPIQILVGIALLIYTLGYSALVGLAVLILSTPMQGQMFVRLITYRHEQMAIVDKRVRLLSEIVNNIRAVKLYAYETFFGDKVAGYRRQELSKLRRNGLNRATMTATMSFIPILAAVLTFITYGLSKHTLNAAIIFSGMQYFNVLRQPISFLPVAFTAVSDAYVAIGRIGQALRADELKRDIIIDPAAKFAVEATGDYQFDSVLPQSNELVGGGGFRRNRARGQANADKKAKKAARKRAKAGLPPLEEEKETSGGTPFSLRDISLKVPRGSLVCVVGRVGTGKTSLLSGLINEMRQAKGSTTFGGPVSYVPQQAWVLSGTIRDNITFAIPHDEVDLDRVEEVIEACALRPDINMWQDGEFTRIGERGITLSGGQRQRICLARAAYDDKSEIVLLDDPLSAVDAHVGHHLLHKCILNGPLADKTRILVTHHLDVLPSADLVLVMDRDDKNEGRIIQQGSYASLRAQEGVFRTLMEEFGSSGDMTEKQSEETQEEEKTDRPTTGGGKLYLDEEREVGAISWRVYSKYGAAMGGWRWVMLCAGFLCFTQAANVGNSLFLGFWSGGSIKGFQQGDYMAVYACLGLAVAIFTWAASYTMILAGIRASFFLFNGAWKAVMRSPVGWHDRTPTGRIINRLSKDIEMLDDRLAQMWNQLLTNALSVVGTFGLVVYSFPWLALVFPPLGFLYYCCAAYYRMSSREVKRVDSILRSGIYGSFGEQLAGLAVIRAFGQQARFIRMMQHSINQECQAYIITITIQRWLGIRLDFLSFFLVFLISAFGSIFRTSVSASKLGVVLTYSLQAASVFSQLVQLFAQVEQEMNNVERVQYYNDLQVEAAPDLPTDPKPAEWPTHGAVEFDDVKLRYRENLPLVLHGLTFSIKPGEKVGIIGRTGAGKSSIAQALFRTVEICDGAIKVDGVDLKGLGLDQVRGRLAIIPQDAFLFAGTVKENVDPQGRHTDAELSTFINLIHENSGNSKSFKEKFQLDAVVLNEGTNFSAGERQLLALIRALARNCKVLMLDEATSSVDPETDAVIQRIIQTELHNTTLISIAHRLQTVAYYDRILVMDAGRIHEFDTPLSLFDTPGSIFRALCDTKQLSREDLVKIQRDAALASSKAQ